ncbi:MAG: type 1 glutamine amidotransferase [Balneolaceae bacterium]|nr:type 1 glutamine amidotransferase [Balneolaceae bacterium]
MRSERPLIGVTGPGRGGTASWWFTRLAVWLQGGRAVRITPHSDPGLVDQLDGLVLGGGADVNPEYYGQQLNEQYDPKPVTKKGIWNAVIRLFSLVLYPLIFLLRKSFAAQSHTVDHQRDELELHYLTRALDRRIPVLGICRGAQLINVKLGGTLYQDITGFYGEVPHVYSIFPKKRVQVDRDSKLGALLGETDITVNALHNQAVHELAEPLTVVAREESGVIQAIESGEYPFLVGVQWHPEYMPHIEGQRRIFRALVEEAVN